MKREILILGIMLLVFGILNAEDSTYTHIKGFSEISFAKQSVSGDLPGYNWLPYGNRNNRTDLNIESSLGNDLYFSGNIIADQTVLQGGIYSFALRHKYGMIKIGQFEPNIGILPDRTVMKGVLLKSNYANNEVEGQYFYDNIVLVNEKIEGNGTEGPFKLKNTNIRAGSESVVLLDDKGSRKTLERNIDYTINYISGEIELKNLILESPCQLLMSYKIEGTKRYDIKEAGYGYNKNGFNVYLRGSEEGMSDTDSLKATKNINIGMSYDKDNLDAGIKVGRSFSDSLKPLLIAGKIDYSFDHFYARTLFNRRDNDYTMFNGTKETNYGIQGGYDNNRIRIEGKYNYSLSDNIEVKKINLASGVNFGKNFISYNYLHLWMDNYEDEKHYVKLSSGLACCEFNLLSGMGRMTMDSVRNRNYFVNGVFKAGKNIHLEVASENRYEIYDDSTLYRYKQYVSMRKRWNKSSVNLNMGLMNDDKRKNIPYGSGRISLIFANLVTGYANFNIRRVNGVLDSTDIPVNNIDLFPKINMKIGLVKLAYTPEMHLGIYEKNKIQKRIIRNGGVATVSFGKLSIGNEFYRYSNIDYDLNDLKSRKTDNYGVNDLFSVKGNVSSTFSTGYSFEYKRDNGLYNIIIPTITDTSGDTLNVIKISKATRHNLTCSFARGKSLLNLKSGYEKNNEYHSDTLCRNFKMADFTAEVGKTFIEGLTLFAGIYTNAKEGFDMEIAQDSGWSYSIGPQFRLKYNGKYGGIYSNYKYIQSYGESDAKINEFKLGGNLHINMFGVSVDCFVRNGIIPEYNVKRISGKIGIYY